MSLYKDLYDHPCYIPIASTVELNADGVCKETVTVMHRGGNLFTNLETGENYIVNKDGKLQPFVAGSGVIPGFIKNQPVLVKASVSTKIESVKTCSCGGVIGDYEGNQVCVSCDRFYGMTK